MDDTPIGIRSGLREAATVIALLEEKEVASVVGFLSPSKVQALAGCIKQLSDLTVSDLVRVLELFEKDFADTLPVGFGIGDKLDKVMDNPLDRVYADSLLGALEETQDLKGLQSIAPERLADALREEPLNLQMTVLACIKPEQAADVLRLMPEEQHTALVSSMGRLEKIPRRVLGKVAQFLGNVLQSEAQESSINLPGVNLAAGILKHLDRPEVDTLLDNLKQSEEQMAEAIAAQMFVFENLCDLTPESLSRLVGQFDNRTLAVSMKGMDTSFQERIYASLSRRAAGYLRDEYSCTGPVRKGEVLKSRQTIVEATLRQLHSGELEMESGGQQDEMME